MHFSCIWIMNYLYMNLPNSMSITNNLLKIMLYTNELCIPCALLICYNGCIRFLSIWFCGKLRGSYGCNNSRPVNQAMRLLHSRKILCILGLLMSLIDNFLPSIAFVLVCQILYTRLQIAWDMFT